MKLESLLKGRPTKNRNETEWINFVGTNESVQNVDYGNLDRTFEGMHGCVASKQEGYINDAKKIEPDYVDTGYVSIENFQFKITSFSMGRENVKTCPIELAIKHKLKSGDHVIYEITNHQITGIKEIL